MRDHNRDSRLSIDSISSTVYGEDEDDDTAYGWSPEQISIIVRVRFSFSSPRFCFFLSQHYQHPVLDGLDKLLTTLRFLFPYST
jgi:hypothetical protein